MSTLDELQPGDGGGRSGGIHRQLDGIDGVRILNSPDQDAAPIRPAGRAGAAGASTSFAPCDAGEDLAGLRVPGVHPRGTRPRRRDLASSTRRRPGRRGGESDARSFSASPAAGPARRRILRDRRARAGSTAEYAAFVAGDRVVARSLNCGRQWMLKFPGGNVNTPDPWCWSGLEYVLANPHEAQLASRSAGPGGPSTARIDYSIRGGRVQTWEISLNCRSAGARARCKLAKVRLDLDPIRRETKEFFTRPLSGSYGRRWIPRQPLPAVHDHSLATLRYNSHEALSREVPAWAIARHASGPCSGPSAADPEPRAAPLRCGS